MARAAAACLLLFLANVTLAQAQVVDEQGTLMQSDASPPAPTSSTGARRLALPASLALPAGVAVGRTPGDFGVSSTGLAQYGIALWTPSGIAGLQPSLSLSYASTFANGLAGVGWSLNGLGAVTRCYKTVAQHGVAGSPDLATTDVFCLGGNALRSFSGTYGADNAQYQTEVADFSLIISHGTSGVGPAWFEVYAKNGLIYEYGNANAGQTTAHAALLAAGSSTVIRWMLNKIRDRVGNHVDFDYTNDATNHVLRPLTITYAAPPGAGTQAQYQVSFSYENRASALNWYYAGTLSQETNRLNQISIQAWNGSAFAPSRNYFLSYGTGTTGLDRITSISECSPTQCFPATTIAYQDATAGWGAQQSAGSVPSGSTGLVRVDLNGDGIDDLIYQNGTTFYYLLGQASGTFLGPYSTGIVNPASNVVPLDYRAKNQADLAFSNSSGNWRICSFTTAGAVFSCLDTSTPFIWGVAADIDGDGYMDLVYIKTSGTNNGNVVYRRNLQGTGFGAETVLYAYDVGEQLFNLQSTNNGPSSGRLRDFNGDGRDDLMVYVKYCLQQKLGGSCPPGVYTYKWMAIVSKADGSYVVGAKFAASATFLWAPILGDYNGDGCADIVTANGTTGMLQVSYGACDGASLGAFSTTAATTLTSSTYSNGNWAYGADVDGDRRADLLLFNNTTSTWGYALSTGSNFGAWTAISPTLTTLNAVGDFNGDGIPDIAGLTTSVLTYRVHSGIAGDLATSFTDGFGVNVSPTYAPLASTSSYTKATGAAYPEADYSGPTWVVTSYSASDGIGGAYNVSETYNGARLNMQGRGFEGFLWKKAQDNRNNFITKDRFALTFPNTGMLVERTLYQSNGTTLISDVTNTLASFTLDATTNNQRIFPYVSQSVASAYEFNGALNGQMISQVTKAYSFLNASSVFDVYGNLWKVTTTTVDKDTTSPWLNNTFTDTVNITPHEDGSTGATGWCVGLADQISEQRTAPGPVSLTHTTAYSVSTDGLCRVLSQTVEPSSSIDKVVTVFDHAAAGCGNVTAATVTGQTPAGGAMTPRVTTMGYGAKCLRPETVTNALSQTTQISYQYELGVPHTVTDPNLLSTTTNYNDLGQVQSVVRPDGTQTMMTLAACTGASCLSDSLLRYSVQRSEQDATSGHATFWYTQEYFDAFGRPKYQMPLQSNGVQTTMTVNYDSRGRAVTRTNPSGNGFAAFTTTTAFDDLNRPTSESRPINSTNPTLESTTFTYQGRTRTVRDPRLYTTTKQFDVIGELRRVTDPDGVSLTSYTYNPFGALTTITDPAGNPTSRSYDTLGYLLSGTSDPDRGSWSYQYDSLGELINVRDAKTVSPAWTQQMSYDALGRLAQRVEAEGTSTFTFGTSAANHEIGQLVQLSGLGDTETNTFDSLGRPASHSMVWSGTTYSINFAYNTLGKLDTLTYPSVPGQANRFQVKYAYSNGYASTVQNYTGNVAGTTFWQLTPGGINMDPWGHVVDETLGTTTPVRIQSAFDAVTSWIGTRQVGTGGSSNNLQSLAYQWDVSGNLSQRQDLKQSLTEAFTNDNLNRLQSSTLNGVANFSAIIDPSGNITSRTEGGVTYPYTYDTTHKHAVANVNGTVYGYDANGNMSTRAGNSITWSSYNLPTLINGSGVSASFSYGPDRQRKQQVSTYTTDGTVGTETTIYVGGIFEVETTPGQVHYKHYVSLPGGTRVIYDLQSVSGAQTTYVTADHLGSGNLMINSAGTVQVNESYSAYGYRRSSNWASPLAANSADYATIAATTRRGYSDAFHEMLDNVGLIHMNGRVYDPVIGRFLSTDPVVAIGGNSQSLNPYSYVQNGPLRFTDPTGFTLSGSLRSYPPVNGSNYGPAIGNICARDPGTCAGIAGDQNVAASTGFYGQDRGSPNMSDGLGGQVPVGWASVGNSAAAFLQGFTGAAGPVTANDIHGQVSDRFQQAMDAIHAGSNGQSSDSISVPKGVGEPGCPDDQPDCVINRPGTDDGESQTSSPAVSEGFVPPSLPQGFIDAGVGFGDGVIAALTWGQVSGDMLRNVVNLSNPENRQSSTYQAAYTSGVVTGTVVTPGALVQGAGGSAAPALYLSGQLMTGSADIAMGELVGMEQQLQAIRQMVQEAADEAGVVITHH
ncbi:MAG: FG-GAP-like repeat-containing protein [Proteobacteria bacterium]|nr:FG-GAP-like repeat-containing protein [Pseudomonadota bacterium]